MTEKSGNMQTVEFTKMHGAGNDYIYVDTMRFPLTHPEKLAVEWSRYHTGIGSDGLVLIGRSEVADFSMRIFNADGSEAMMCGNASRCIGKYVYEYGLTRKTEVTLETLSGIKRLLLHLDDVNAIDLAAVGPQLEWHPFFPGRINVEFAQLLPDGSIRMRVWERGSGITMACGTGACATAVAAHLTGRRPRTSTIVMDGGTLHITWDEATGHVMMTGPATIVFDGKLEIRE